MKTFKYFIEESMDWEQQDADDWWSAVPVLLIDIGKLVNRVKSSLGESDLQVLRGIYRRVKDTSKSNKEKKNYSGFKDEKLIMKEFLETFNSYFEKTGVYAGIEKPRQKGSYVSRSGGRWVTMYKLIYGKSQSYIKYSF